MASFLETTITKFLDTEEDSIAVTKYLNEEDSIAVTKYLDAAEDGIAVTKYLEEMEDSIAVTKYLSGTPTYNTMNSVTDAAGNQRNVNMTIIQFLEENDISVTKFLQHNANVQQSMNEDGQRMNIIQFLDDNDISVTKFMEYMGQHLDTEEQNMLIIEFLQ